MSSAILYLAIVAIWAVVLVPRWLRQPHAEAPSAEADLAPAVTESDVQPSGMTEGSFADEDDVVTAEEPAAGPAWSASADDRGEPSPGRQEPGPRPGREQVVAASPDARRARILQARRRTLITLILLTAGAVAMAMAHLAAAWVAIPPTALLVFFLLLLRTAARIDAQRTHDARVRARAEAARPAPAESSVVAPEAYEAAQQGPPEPAPDASARTAGVSEPGAEIITISVRAEDQPYDQYVDAEARAVGD